MSESFEGALDEVGRYCERPCPCETVCLAWRVVFGGGTAPVSEAQAAWIAEQRRKRG